MILHQLQPSFNNGEITPLLYDRVDYEKFFSSLKSGKNMFVHFQGGASNRAGTMMLYKCKDEKVRLIPFEFSNTETYTIEFGNGYCRFFTTDGIIVTENEEGEQVPYEINSPFETDDLDNLRVCQSGDVMYIASGKKPQTLVRYGHTNWAFEEYDYKNGPFLVNTDNYKTSIKKETVEGINSFYLETPVYKFSSSDVGRYFNIEATVKGGNLGGTVTSTDVAQTFESDIFFVASEYTLKTNGTWSGSFALQISDDLETWETKTEFVSYNESSNYDYAGDFSTSPKFVRFNFYKLETYSNTGLNFNFRSNSVSFNVPLQVVEVVNENKAQVSLIDYPSYLLDCIILQEGDGLQPYTFPVLTSNTSSPDVTISGTISTINDAWKMFDNNDSTYIEMPQSEVNNIDINFNKEQGLFFNYVSLRLKSRYYGGSLVKTAIKVGLYALQGGSWKWFGFFRDDEEANGIYTVNVTSGFYKGIRIAVTSNDASANGGYIYSCSFGNLKYAETKPNEVTMELGSWYAGGDYPTDVDLYQDRIEWITNNTLDATKISDYTNFAVSSDVVDDDAISVIIKDKKVNKINSIVGGARLVAFTEDGNFIHDENTFTPSTATFRKQGSTGGASVKPIVVRDNVIYVQPMRSAISNYAYSFETDGYAGEDITLLAQHLFVDEKIKEMHYQQEPYSIIWVLQESGKVLACTYLRQQNVLAWTPMDFGGEVQSMCVLSNGANQELFLAVKRKNGTFVEKMPTRRMNDTVIDRFFVDCGRMYQGTPATVISGLEHLEGENVSVLADGNVIEGKKVENGQITLDVPASTVVVGLPYESVLETLTFDANTGDGSNLNRKKRVVAVSIKVLNSAGCKVSVNGNREVSLISDKRTNYNTPIVLYSGFCKQILPSSHNESANIKIRQTLPLPITISTIIPQLEYEK